MFLCLFVAHFKLVLFRQCLVSMSVELVAVAVGHRGFQLFGVFRTSFGLFIELVAVFVDQVANLEFKSEPQNRHRRVISLKNKIAALEAVTKSLPLAPLRILKINNKSCF